MLGDGYANQRGGMSYSQWVEFDDGYKGLATSNSPLPPYQVGQLVLVEETQYKTKKGQPKIKVKKINGGDGMPQQPQSPSAGAQTPSVGFSDEKEQKIRNGMICNCMSRLVAGGKSVSEAHTIALEIVSTVEGAHTTTMGVSNEEEPDAPF